MIEAVAHVRQALMVLAHLRKGETYRDLAVGFGVGTTSAYRSLREALQILTSLAPTLERATQVAAREYVILDGPRPRARQPGLKNWRILRKIRSSPAHVRILVVAIQTLIVNAEAVRLRRLEILTAAPSTTAFRAVATPAEAGTD